MKSIFIFLVFSALFCYIESLYEKVLIRDVTALTLYRDRYTIGRKPIPQLSCFKGCSRQPEVVQCVNVGFDGIDAQWKCTANLDKKVKFGKLTVSCEGYDYPKDPYIIRGSCGLEYELVYNDGSTNNYTKDWSLDGMNFGFIIFIGIIILFFILKCCESPTIPPKTNYQSSAPPPYSSTADPPGFRQSFTEPQPNSGGPGFWSGLGLGGLGGYFMGRNTGSSHSNYYDNYSTPSFNSRSSFYSRPSYTHDDDTYSAEGYGDTKRR